ncbi:hypothetical protein [Dokdonella sp.]|uniref:FG-GAP repeat protein n=1 Tax=Dokdonella sp. TaxID=2291710 RepID=UPI003C34E6DE
MIERIATVALPLAQEIVVLRRLLHRFGALAPLALVVVTSGAVAQTQLLAPTEVAAELAYSVALDGSHLAAGAPGALMKSGRVYTYACIGQSCANAVPLAPVDLDAGDLFGAAVSLSINTLAVGAPEQGAGAVYVFTHDGANWSLQQKIVAAPVLPGERFGSSVAVEGDRLAVGAPGANAEAGAVYVFERAGVNWSQSDRLQATDASSGDALGSSVALSADTILTGAPQWAPVLAGAYSRGAAYVFEFVSPGWMQQARLLPTVAGDGDTFGHAVSLSGDRAVVGAPLADLRVGNAIVFERSGPVWTQQAQLLAPVGLPGDRFGWSVALDGDQLIVGAPFALEGCGGSTLFTRPAGSWVASTDPALSRASPGGLVGWSVATRGQSWLVGIPGYSGAPSHVGAALWRDSSDGLFNDGFEKAGIDVCVPPEKRLAAG